MTTRPPNSRFYAFLCLLVSVALTAAGCAPFEFTPDPDSSMDVETRKQDLASILRALPENKEKEVIEALVTDLRVTTQTEPVLNTDGTPKLGPDGKPLFRTYIVQERGIPTASEFTRFRGNKDFTDSSFDANLSENSDGSVLTFTQVDTVNEGSVQTANESLTARSQQAYNFGEGLVEGALALGGKYVENVEGPKAQAEIQRQERDDARWFIQQGILPPGYTYLPREEHPTEAPVDEGAASP